MRRRETRRKETRRKGREVKSLLRSTDKWTAARKENEKKIEKKGNEKKKEIVKIKISAQDQASKSMWISPLRNKV